MGGRLLRRRGEGAHSKLDWGFLSRSGLGEEVMVAEGEAAGAGRRGKTLVDGGTRELARPRLHQLLTTEASICPVQDRRYQCVDKNDKRVSRNPTRARVGFGRCRGPEQLSLSSCRSLADDGRRTDEPRELKAAAELPLNDVTCCGQVTLQGPSVHHSRASLAWRSVLRSVDRYHPEANLASG